MTESQRQATSLTHGQKRRRLTTIADAGTQVIPSTTNILFTPSQSR
jgi:hypothetical protein